MIYDDMYENNPDDCPFRNNNSGRLPKIECNHIDNKSGKCPFINRQYIKCKYYKIHKRNKQNE
jgi:hypothetical protein